MSPARNDVFAAEMICSEYSGYRCAMSAALANDFCSWSRRPLTCSDRGRCDDRRREGGDVPGGQQRTEQRLHHRAAEIPLQVGRSGRHPGAGHRHRPGERMRRRGAGEADADAHQTNVSSTGQYGMSCLPGTNATTSPSSAERVADQQREPGALRFRRTWPTAARRPPSPRPPAPWPRRMPAVNSPARSAGIAGRRRFRPSTCRR